MDMMLYVSEDCSYRASRVDMFLTILLHPHEDRVVGIKLKGVRFLFERVKAILKLSDSDFLPLVAVLEVALTAALTASMTDASDGAPDTLTERYAEVRSIIGGVDVPSEEWQPALQAA